MAVIVALMIAVLYYATPNVRLRGFKWVTVGAAVALLVWVVASALFAFYVANFGSYNKTYGALAGVVVFLVWFWITNLALLVGIELDAERERTVELKAACREPTRRSSSTPATSPSASRPPDRTRSSSAGSSMCRRDPAKQAVSPAGRPQDRAVTPGRVHGEWRQCLGE
jgi:hypothetical protein